MKLDGPDDKDTVVGNASDSPVSPAGVVPVLAGWQEKLQTQKNLPQVARNSPEVAGSGELMAEVAVSGGKWRQVAVGAAPHAGPESGGPIAAISDNSHINTSICPGVDPAPCDLCGSPDFWVTAYEPFRPRCAGCAPPPGPAAVHHGLVVWTRSGGGLEWREFDWRTQQLAPTSHAAVSSGRAVATAEVMAAFHRWAGPVSQWDQWREDDGTVVLIRKEVHDRRGHAVSGGARMGPIRGAAGDLAERWQWWWEIDGGRSVVIDATAMARVQRPTRSAGVEGVCTEAEKPADTGLTKVRHPVESQPSTWRRAGVAGQPPKVKRKRGKSTKKKGKGKSWF